MGRTRRAHLIGALVALVLLGAACEASDGRTLPPPEGGTTTPARLSPPSTRAPFALASAAVDDGGVLAAEHTCRGAGTHPDLEWGPAPPAAELAIVARYQDGGLVWVVGGIDPAVEAIAAGGLPEGAVAVILGADLSAWQPPCPEAGHMAVVEVVLHVLPEPVALDPALDPAEAAGLIEGTSTARAQVDLVAVGE